MSAADLKQLFKENVYVRQVLSLYRYIFFSYRTQKKYCDKEIAFVIIVNFVGPRAVNKKKKKVLSFCKIGKVFFKWLYSSQDLNPDPI